MAKEILLYGGIYNFTIERLIESLEAYKDEDVVLRINSGGGDVLAVYGAMAKFAEHGNSKKIKVDGQAASAAAFFLAYSNDVEALDVSEIMIHRAAYPEYYEKSEGFKGSNEEASLIKVNKDLRRGLESKIDVDAFAKVTGKTLDEVFSLESRIDVQLTAQQAKKIGLINKVNKLTAEMRAEIGTNIKMAASSIVGVEAVLPEIQEQKPKPVNMTTLEELKTKHPDLYALAVSEGVSTERERVKAFMAFGEIDYKAVKAKIEEGTDFMKAQSFIADMTLAKISMNQTQTAESEEALEALESNKPKAVVTATPSAESEAEAKISAFQTELQELRAKK